MNKPGGAQGNMGTQGLRRYLFNSGWLLAEHFLKAVVGILIGFYVGRYLGPENFGVMNYLISIISFVGVVGRLGLDNLVVRDLVDPKEDALVVMGTSFWNQLLASIIVSFAVVAYFYFEEANRDLWVYASIMCAGVVIQAFNVVDWYFQAKVQAVVAVRCRVIATIFASLAKVIGVWAKCGLAYFFWTYFFEFFTLAVFYLFAARSQGLGGFLKVFRLDAAKTYLYESAPLLVASISAMIGTKINQIMLRNILGDEVLGLYSASLRFYEAWVMLPYLVSVSMLPALKRAKDESNALYEERLVLLIRVLFWSSGLVSVGFLLFSREIVDLTYGAQFSGAASVLGVVMLSTVFAALGSCNNRFYIVENMPGAILKRTLVSATLNTVINFWSIPAYGMLGAAWATLVSLFVSSVVIDLFDKSLRRFSAVKFRAILFFRL